MKIYHLQDMTFKNYLLVELKSIPEIKTHYVFNSFCPS